ARSYNNAQTLADVLAGIEALGLAVIVVNDGSTDATAEILERWKAAGRHGVTHPMNRGKAAALRTGFALARDLGFTHAVTIDTDGQLDPQQIPELLAAAEQAPNALVLGCRDDLHADYPT